MDTEAERWKPIKNYENKYEISNLGRLRYVGAYQNNRNGASNILKPRIRVIKGNYRRVSYSLSNGKSHTEKKAHHLVAEAFLGERPENMEVDHKDRNPLNNNVENLRYVSKSQNLLNKSSFGSISKNGNGFRSEYSVNKKMYTKTFKTFEECEEYHIEMFPFYEAMRLEICDSF
jgi:hypothetical protein